MKKILIVSAVAMILPTAAFADVAAELSTAQTHAGLAAKAADLKGVQMHLHHAVNCLVGPDGQGFDPSNANPCGKAGKGAIPDSMDAGQKAKLQTAVADANEGLTATDLASAQKAAQTTAEAIGAAK